MSRTPYAETEFLLASMEGNREEMDRLAEGMLPGERRTFIRQLLAAADQMEDRT